MKNKYKVPKKQWSKWSPSARRIFNLSYNFFINNQDLMIHPKATTYKNAHWKTTAWNSAWIAADACDNNIPTKVIMNYE